MTRYMLDAIPDGAEASDGDVATASDGSASAAGDIAHSDVPVAVDTPAVVPADDQGQAEETPAGSSEAPASPSDTPAESVDAAAATSAISTPESSPSADLASSASPVSLTMILHSTLAYIISSGHTFCRCLRQHTRTSQRCQPRHGPWRLWRLGRLCARHHPIRTLIHRTLAVCTHYPSSAIPSSSCFPSLRCRMPSQTFLGMCGRLMDARLVINIRMVQYSPSLW